MTLQERAQLEAEAGERTLSAYIRSRLFGVKGKRGPDRRPAVDSVMLARILARFGQSGIAGNLKLIADAARTGTLETGTALNNALIQACGDIAVMRCELIRALGVKPE